MYSIHIVSLCERYGTLTVFHTLKYIALMIIYDNIYDIERKLLINTIYMYLYH